ncbi:GPW/gp25 family protein [Leeuwenhoekiella palythoae]|uniref:GPW/gp25 family protein n=2 Tax=Leeuwenhoekiella TaxID=283735 RepID=UPI001CE176D2|nr:GPW/gp25 family protein [Leeuwenhoekiella palythoae]UBZ10413.1 GPW/gp25 family protein [Leeuwenhoekiella palythoae]
MKIEESFLGIGWSFPPEFNKETKSIQMVSAIEDINQSLHILLNTKLGERIMLPNYGSSLSDFVFEGLNMSTRTYIVDRVKMAILYNERRIELDKIDFDQSRILEGEVLMIVHYTVRLTNSRGNMVYPFYINEGTELKSL